MPEKSSRMNPEKLKNIAERSGDYRALIKSAAANELSKPA